MVTNDGTGVAIYSCSFSATANNMTEGGQQESASEFYYHTKL